jgi:hypothetical protein
VIIFGKIRYHCETLFFWESMEEEYILFWKSFNSISNFVVLMFVFILFIIGLKF